MRSLETNQRSHSPASSCALHHMPASCSVLLSASRWRCPRWRSTRIRSHDGQEEVPRKCDGRRPCQIPGHAQEVCALLRHAQVRQLEYRFSIRTGYWLSSGCGCFLRNSVGARSIFQLWSCTTTSSPLFVNVSPTSPTPSYSPHSSHWRSKKNTHTDRGCLYFIL